MNILKRIGNNFFWGFLSETLGKGLMFCLIVILSRRLEPEYFGIFSYTQSLFMFLWILIDLGLGLYGTREIARQKNDQKKINELTSDILITRTILAIIVSATTTIVVTIFQNDVSQKWFTVGFALYLIVRANQIDWLLRGLENYRALFFISVSSYLILFLSGFFLISSKKDLFLASTPWLLMSLSMTIIGFLYLHSKYKYRFLVDSISIKKIKHKWKVSIYFTLSNGVSALYEASPIFFLYLLSNPQEVGYYSAPYRLIVAFFFVVSIYPMVIFPVISNLYLKDIRVYTKTISLSAIGILIFTCLISLYCWIFADQIIIYLFTENYIESINIFKILLLFFVLRSLRSLLVRAICAANCEKEYSKIAIQTLLLLIILMIIAYICGIFNMYTASIILVVSELFITLQLLTKVVSNIKQSLLFEVSKRQKES